MPGVRKASPLAIIGCRFAATTKRLAARKERRLIARGEALRTPGLLMRARFEILLLPILAGIAFLPVEPAPYAPQPKLAVLVVFDQMRGDYLERWQDLYVADGFQRLQTGGPWFTHCHYPHAFNLNGAGHACILAGFSPDRT